MIRRLKNQVLKQLPDKQRQMILLDQTTVKINKSEMSKFSATCTQNRTKDKVSDHVVL